MYLSDESEEGPPLVRALAARGFDAQSVPLGELTERVEAKRPALIVCDLDAAGALDAVAKLRELEGGERIDVVFIASGAPDGDAVSHEGSGLFLRPVDATEVVRKVEALLGMSPASGAPSLPSTTPPPTAASHAPPALPSTTPPKARGEAPSEDPQRSSYPADEEHRSYPSLPAPVPLGFAPEPEAPRAIPQTEMSPELESLLARAEQRVGSMAPGRSDKPPPSMRMSPEEEVEAVLPVEVLAALDEPLDVEAVDEDSDAGSGYGTRSGSASGRTGLGTGTGAHAGSGPGTGIGTAAGTVAGPMSTAFVSSMGTSGAEPTAPPPRGTSAGRTSVASQPPISPRTGTAASTRRPDAGRDGPRVPPPSWPAPPPNAMVTAVEAPAQSGAPIPSERRRLPEIIGAARSYEMPLGAPPPVRIDSAPLPAAPSGPRPEDAPPAAGAPRTPDIPAVLGRGDALRALARAVRSRFSGALAVEDSKGIRRVVMRDGDIVIAASGAEGESLVAFLSERGVLAPDVAARMGHRLPAFGRHAGAALIANGHLRQDELWPVLRAHSEWILGHILLMESGGASVERDVPPRLAAEPAAFGGATGAEVLVEIARRVVTPDEASARLGGPSARLAEGPSAALLGECALPDPEVALVSRANGASVGEVLAAAPDPAFAAVLLTLQHIGVLEVVRPQPGAAEPRAEGTRAPRRTG